MKKANKNVIKELITEKEAELEQNKRLLVKAELLERFMHRKALVIGTTNGDQAIGAAQTNVRNITKAVKATEEYLVFLHEVENE